jgi:hypothetical protein
MVNGMFRLIAHSFLRGLRFGNDGRFGLREHGLLHRLGTVRGHFLFRRLIPQLIILEIFHIYASLGFFFHHNGKL